MNMNQYIIPQIFNNNFIITQFFGQNDVIDYTRFGMIGHNGVDFIPVWNEKWDVQSVSNGVVTETGFDSGFGNFIKIKTDNQIWLYAHLAEIWVERNRIVTKGQKIGLMGNTGHSTGAHLHLGLKLTDNLGNVLNKNNGYFGAIDPLPFLIENKTKNPTVSENQTVQTQRKFEIKEYQDAWNEKDYEWFANSLVDRDLDLIIVKKENQNLRNQVDNNSYKIIELNKTILDQEEKIIMQKNKIEDLIKTSIVSYSDSFGDINNTIAKDTTKIKLESKEVTTSKNKPFYESKKLITLFFSIIVSILVVYFDIPNYETILSVITPMIMVYLGGQTLVDLDIVKTLTTIFKKN